MNAKRLIGLVALGLALTACAPAPIPTLSPTTVPMLSPVPPAPTASPSVVGQRHVCGVVRSDACETAIALVLQQEPSLASSSLVVADVRYEDAWNRRGGNFEMLVMFDALASDAAAGPSTWVVTHEMLSDDVRVEHWRDGSLPPHFVELLSSAGLPG